MHTLRGQQRAPGTWKSSGTAGSLALSANLGNRLAVYTRVSRCRAPHWAEDPDAGWDPPLGYCHGPGGECRGPRPAASGAQPAGASALLPTRAESQRVGLGCFIPNVVAVTPFSGLLQGLQGIRPTAPRPARPPGYGPGSASRGLRQAGERKGNFHRKDSLAVPLPPSPCPNACRSWGLAVLLTCRGGGSSGKPRPRHDFSATVFLQKPRPEPRPPLRLLRALIGYRGFETHQSKAGEGGTLGSRRFAVGPGGPSSLGLCDWRNVRREARLGRGFEVRLGALARGSPGLLLGV